MARSALPRTRSRAVVLVAAVLGLGATTVAPAAAHPPDDVIVLPGATSAEGIAGGEGATFYAGDLFAGDVFRGDLRRGTAELFIDAPEGRMAVGMDTDLRHGLLFVAGGATGQAYVYDLHSGKTVETYEFGPATTDPEAAPDTFVNDVVVTPDGAWFTDSVRARLFFVPIGWGGRLGERFHELPLDEALTTDTFPNLNGITATDSGRTLIVAHSTNAALYTVDPWSGDTREIELEDDVELTDVDGIELADRTLWAVQNTLQQISEIRLDHDLASGRVEEVVTDEDFDVPTTAILWEGGLAAVNAQFGDTLGPEANPFEVVLVDL
jgi:sugar lactone lactonase YvrE